MSNDNKTLADVQPGGRVRLGNVRDRVMGECEQWFDTTDVDMEAATDSIIAAAQPSPGGHGSITVDDLSQVIRQVDGNHTLGAGSLAEAILAKLPHLAARQPVGEPVAWMTHHDEPMLFPTAAEASAYCEDDEQPVPLFRSPAQAVDLGQLPRAVELLSNVSRTLVDWAAEEQREAIGIVKALIDIQAVGNG
ncbi:hypothetical protein ACTJJM_05225 [Stenotrophomonas sp. 22692]|uniref:hypothetical protein n=1 Tax=Stenotrophomonas sp. 22692 TaxID=3453956 RepID=UPI003F874A8E